MTYKEAIFVIHHLFDYKSPIHFLNVMGIDYFKNYFSYFIRSRAATPVFIATPITARAFKYT